MQKAEKRLNAICKKAQSSGITNESLLTLEITKILCKPKRNYFKWAVLIGLTFATLFTLKLLNNDGCYLEYPFDTTKIFREPENCDICLNVTGVDRVKNISPMDFDELYSSKSRPVIVTDGTRGWSAIRAFNFNFFKNLYHSINDDATETECQFFPYKTEFHSLSEVLDMDVDRSQLRPGTKSWYVGWSNCNDQAGKILRQHYTKPYFLPETSENLALNWLFMGGPGSGAHMHIDDVLYPSWQAQLSGRKTWRLAPPPECFYKCQEITATVEPGEIIVVDTNRWYHQTFILPGSISITIGSEFD